jgi:peptidyl-tRNA hydrolase
VAGHNGLRSLSRGLGGKDFWRVRGGVGRPNSTDPEVVSSYVLSGFREPDEEVRLLIHSAADEVERLLGEIIGPETGMRGRSDDARARDSATHDVSEERPERGGEED